MYSQTYWQDHVTEFLDRYKEVTNPDGTVTHTPVEGEILQQGTPQNQTNFNNIENGVQDVSIAAAIIGWANLHQQRRNDAHILSTDLEIHGELHTITLHNTASAPFNSSVDSPTTIALETTRKNLFYTVEAEVVDHTGLVGDIEISGKALNGFKIAYTGSGSSVTLAVRVKGGMT